MGRIDIRAYDPGVATAVTALWRREIGDRYPLRGEVLQSLLEENPSYAPGDALVAWDGAQPVGFAYIGLLRERDPETADRRGVAWLQAVVVGAGHRRRGVGSRLVRGLMAIAAREGIASVECGGGFGYLWPGLPGDLPDAMPFAAALGFDAGERTWDLRGDVSGLADGVAALHIAAAGMRVDLAGPDDRETLLRFLVREFGGEWWQDTRLFLDQGGAISDFVLLRDASGGIAGHARLHTPATRPAGPPFFWAERRPAAAGGLGPIGVARSLRGQGLGRALLVVALARLRDAGLTDVVIDFTNLLDFYGPLGFRPWMEFTHARGQVEEVARRAAAAGEKEVPDGR